MQKPNLRTSNNNNVYYAVYDVISKLTCLFFWHFFFAWFTSSLAIPNVASNKPAYAPLLVGMEVPLACCVIPRPRSCLIAPHSHPTSSCSRQWLGVLLWWWLSLCSGGGGYWVVLTAAEWDAVRYCRIFITLGY